MTSKKFILKFHHNGTFRPRSYMGGHLHIQDELVDVDKISYWELMGIINKHMSYEKIGGIFLKDEKTGLFIPLENDKDVVQYMEKFDDGADLIFFIDNAGDEIETDPKIQYDVSVQLGKSANEVIRQSPKKAVKEKRKYVTVEDLKKQLVRKLGANKKISPNSQECQEEQVGESVTQDVELIRAATIEKNKAKLDSLGLTRFVNPFGNSQIHKKSKNKETLQRDEDDGEYVPTDADFQEIEDTETVKITTKKTTKSRKRNDEVNKNLPKRMTRSRATPSLATAIDETVMTQEIDKQELRHKVSTPNVVKQLQYKNEGIGSMEKFLEMRKRQSEGMNLQDAEVEKEINEEVGSVDMVQETMERQSRMMEQGIDSTDKEPELPLIEVFGEAKRKRYRGQTKLDAVHTRKFEDRKRIEISALLKQPIAPEETLTEFSNFLGTLAREYVPLDYVSWHKVPCKEELWGFVKQKFDIPEEGKSWVMKSMAEDWRVYKARIKLKHFTAYANDAERRKNRPTSISINQFETLLKYWNDPKVQALSEKNSKNRKNIKDHHTCGPIGFSRVRTRLQKEKVDSAEPSKAELFLATRKRKEGRQYKDADATKEKLAVIEEKLLSSGGENMEQMEEIIGDTSSRGREFLLGRVGHIKKAKSTGECSSAATSKITNMSEEAVQQIKLIVREEVKNEVIEEVGKSMQATLGAIIHKLCRKNPSLNLNLDGVLSSDSDSSPSDIG